MAPGRYRFDDFTLDLADRQLRRGDVSVELNARYLDALALLVREQGRLISKDRFLDEVWRGVPVTDEALTQCIRTLRQRLGDSVASPRFIETVPKHGYRFIAAAEWVEDSATALRDAPPTPTQAPAQVPKATASNAPASPAAEPPTLATSAASSPVRYSWRQCFVLGAAGTTGAGVAGIFGGLFYGFASASQPLPGMGAVSSLLVLVCLNVVVALIAGAGVSFGIAASGLLPGRRWRWSIVGGALGGLVVGAVVKLLGVDAFNLLFGQSPGDITGAPEGVLLGGSVGFGIWLGSRSRDDPTRWTRRSIAGAALAGAAAGIIIPLLGGRLMGGSLDLLARSFPHSRLRLDEIGTLLGEHTFGPISQAVTGCLEGALFGSCIVGAMVALSPLLATQVGNAATTSVNPLSPAAPR
jgi:DNA-binding winged helix-turn-helix (wHTH) protein